jgi:hypothetical protein
MSLRRPKGMRLLPGARTPSDRGRPALTLTALGAVAAIALAGCAVAHPAGGSENPSVTATKSPGRSAAGPEQRAKTDAGAILASFAPPPGARRLAAAPAVDSGALKTAIQIPGTPDLVDEASWWLAPGKPQQVLAWETGHVPHRYAAAGTATVSLGGRASAWSDMFSLPAVNGVLDSRELVVEVVKDGDQTAIRVDAQVTWQPATPASDRVPAAAKAVTIALDLGMNQRGKKPPAPVTITGPAKVSQLEALINGQQLFPQGAGNCPADFGDSLTLTFRASAGGPALAVATDQLSGCRLLSLRVGGRSQPTLSGVSGSRILAIAGLPWKLPSL